MEPITTSIAVATSAFNLISKGVAAGRDLNSLFGNIGKNMGAINDIDYKAHKKPKMFQKIFTGSSIEQEAMEAFAAKKKAEHMTQELKTWINLAYGPKAWDEILQLQGQIRKQRRELIYKKKEQEEELIAIALTIVGVLLVSGITLFVLNGLGII